MPYVLVSATIRLDVGPTLCGDEQSDPQLMANLEATLEVEPGYTFKVYRSPLSPRLVLNKLEELGYHLVGQSGIGQTCAWTMYKPSN